MSKSEVLSVDLLRVDGDTQARVAVNQDVVDEYAELVSAGKFWPFESITVFHDGTDYWIADGFHRTLAAKQAGRSSVPCNVITGTARDARIYGMTANDEHGLRMSRDDRRKNVIWLLEKYPTLTQKEIADKTGAGERTVRRIVEEKKEENEKRPLAGDPPKTLGKVNKKESKEPATAKNKEAERAKKLAEREAEKARKAAEREAEKVRKAAEKEAEKVRKAAEREAAKIAKEAERAAAKEAAAKAKEEAKKAERAAKAKAREEEKEAARKELPAKEQEKMIREVFNQHHGRIIKAMADFFELNPNRAALNANMKLLNQVKLW